MARPLLRQGAAPAGTAAPKSEPDPKGRKGNDEPKGSDKGHQEGEGARAELPCTAAVGAEGVRGCLQGSYDRTYQATHPGYIPGAAPV